jgi:uncharacterized membrane protein YraQ (UPF0718 family)
LSATKEHDSGKGRRLWVSLARAAGIVALVCCQPIATALWEYRDKVALFLTIFQGIFIEALPFLLLGALASGFLAVYVKPEVLSRFLPRNRVLGVLAGGLIGMIYPVCECGAVPVVRRLYQKGMTPAAGISFLLASPVLNIIVIFSTAQAFGWGKMVVARVIMCYVTAVVTGLVFSRLAPGDILLPEVTANPHDHTRMRWNDVPFWKAMSLAGDEFMDMVRYLIIGALAATLAQVLIPQSFFLSWAKGPVLSVVAMATLAFTLSLCSNVDAFVALGFASFFAPGALLAFLVFGSMISIKNVTMFRSTFRQKAIWRLILVPLVISWSLAILFNLLWRN